MEQKGIHFPHISIIIPVYNTEKYLAQCLDSVVNQCRENIEIILIDDGSTDKSGAICDEYAKRDPRIKVLHTTNNGLSAARNKGISVANGKWIAFLDSDDWLEEHYFRTIETAINTYQADIISFGYYEDYRNKAISRPICEVLEENVSREQYVRKKNYNNAIWNKVYKRDLFSVIRFPEGYNYEDVIVSFEILDKCKRLVCVPDLLIHYRRRKSSIVTSYDLKDLVDCWSSNIERLTKFGTKSPEYKTESVKGCVVAAASVWCWDGGVFRKQQAVRKNYSAQYKEIQMFASNNMSQIREGEYSLFCKVMVPLLRYDNSIVHSILYCFNRLYRAMRRRELYD